MEVKPPLGVAVTVVEPVLPPVIVRVAGLSERLKAGVAPTTMLTAVEVEEAKVELPPYCAVMLSVPAGSAVVLSVAFPDPSSVPVPRLVLPLRNVTAPEGVAVPDAGVTTALRVTLPPVEMLLALAVSLVVVPMSVAVETTTLTAAEVDTA